MSSEAVVVRFLAVLVLAGCASACTHSYDVERRETRVNVWLTVPELAEQGGRIDALIYVGPYKVVQGPVIFPKGTPTVNLPPLYIRGGRRDVAAVLDGGRYSVRESVDVRGECWVQVILRNGRLTIAEDDEQPDPRGR